MKKFVCLIVSGSDVSILPLHLSRLSGCISMCLVMPSGVRLSGCLSLLVACSLLLTRPFTCPPVCLVVSRSPSVSRHLSPFICPAVYSVVSGCLDVFLYSSPFIRFPNLAAALRLLITFLSSLLSQFICLPL